MSTNHLKESLDCEATLIGQEEPDYGATIVGDDSPPQQSPQELEATSSSPHSLNEAQSTTIVTLVNKFLAKAVERKATHILIEPEANFLSIRYSQGDVLKPLIDPISKKLSTPILTRLKLMAGLEIDHSQTSQKGRIRKRGGGRTIYFCVQTQPSFYGEKMTIHVLDSGVEPPSLEQIISEPTIRTSLEEIIKGSSGLFVVTSSEKQAPTSLLYSLLCGEGFNPKEMASVEKSMSYLIPGMNQLEVDVDQEKDYTDVLPTLLEEDKPRIMVDHLSDPSVTRMVAEMAANDRFVVTSLSAENGINAIALLREMVSPDLLSDTLLGVIHQHHLPRLCPACRIVHEPNAMELVKLGISQTQNNAMTFYQPRSLNETEIEQMRQKGRLCRQCNGDGYHGDLILYELLQITPTLKEAIAQGADLKQLQQAALEGQDTSLMTQGLELVKQGQISVADLAKLCPDLLEESLEDEHSNLVPNNIKERLEKVETLLMVLTQEFNQLKQALESTQQPSSLEINKEKVSFHEIFSPGNIPQDLPSDVDLCKETISAGSSLYEELQDPGDWEALRRELDPNQETMIADFPNDKPTDNNGFKSIPDPWS